MSLSVLLASVLLAASAASASAPSEPVSAAERVFRSMVPTKTLNEAAGFFGPVVKRYMPQFDRFSKSYAAREDKMAVIAAYLPVADKALAEARRMRVPARYEKEKADYLRLFEAVLASVRLTVKLSQLSPDK